MSTTSILRALDSAVQAAVDLPNFHKENTRRSLDGEASPWSRSMLVPARPTTLNVGAAAQREMQGVYQVDLLFPQDQGPSAAHTLADELVAAFPVGTVLRQDGLLINCETSYVIQAPQAPGKYYMVPVRIEYTCIV